MSRSIIKRGYKNLKPIKPSKRWYICPHCGSQHQSQYHDENGMSQCPFCGTWALPVKSKEARLYERVLSAVSREVDEKQKYEVAEAVFRRMVE